MQAGLDSLRKNGEQGTNFPKNIPRGLKADRFRAHYGTTEVVPFQSNDFSRSQ
jgi:hypothetical protein